MTFYYNQDLIVPEQIYQNLGDFLCISITDVGANMRQTLGVKSSMETR